MSSLTQYQQIIHFSRYSRFLWDERRRETYPETVARYYDYFQDHLKTRFNYKLGQSLRSELEDATLSLQVMPSMRAFMTAGAALERDGLSQYNCSYIAINHMTAFDQILYLLMCGAGVGFSVERQHVNQLPVVSDEFYDANITIEVADSKIGWAKALKELIALLYAGQIPRWDTSKVRAAGSPLKTFGGRASGPEPLDNLFNFAVKIFRNAAGRRLTSLECHDLICMIGDIVVVGGVRRSALISLSNLSDDRLRHAKSGEWWNTDPHRRLANNSAVYDDERPEIGSFMREWLSLFESKSGERGIFNRAAAQKKFEEIGREWVPSIGANPCGEILLRSHQLCNLTEAVIRANDSKDEIREKVRLATILGTFQSTVTHFRYVSNRWKKNCEEERLLGVSLTGIMDNAFMAGYDGESELAEFLGKTRSFTRSVNEKLSEEIGVNPSAAITCIKPSGTVSQLVGSASGIHPRHSQYYIRNVRFDVKDPIAKTLIEQGFPYEDDIMSKGHSYVFPFPMKIPEGATTRFDVSAIQQLELWKLYRQHWCDHNPSITVNIRDDEWMDVGAWVYKNFDEICGVSFLPYSDHVYQQAPFEDCTQERYEQELQKLPQGEIDWAAMQKYEETDMTEGAQTLACMGGQCEIN